MIADGGAGMGHSPQMPSYGSVLDKQAISDIIAYIDSLCMTISVSGNPDRGKHWYSESGCDGCHGTKGRGDGPAALALNPRPADFCTAAKHLTDELNFKMITDGGASMGHSPAMPAWGGVLDEQTIWDLIAYMHALCGK
jgi:mono/diheme cytochrome c family protein